MKPITLIGLFFLVVAGVAIAGVLVGISLEHSNPAVAIDATNIADTALV
jgi:hypothetical protein